MQKVEISLYEVGYCKHPEFMVKKGGSFKSIKFPAMVALIAYADKNLLFDTGYGKYFFEATQKFPEKLYAITTPVTLEKSLCEMIDKKIDTIFISHFHADHIGGLKDFPEAKILCAKEEYEIAKSKISRFSKTKKGILPSLLPDDFEQRVTYIEALEKVVLPDSLAPFTQGYKVEEDFYAIELPGHAKGQYGLVVEDTFFISDAVWDMDTIIKGIMPNILTHLIFDDAKVYKETIKKLQELHRRNPQLKIVPTHCSRTHRSYSNA